MSGNQRYGTYFNDLVHVVQEDYRLMSREEAVDENERFHTQVVSARFVAHHKIKGRHQSGDVIGKTTGQCEGHLLEDGERALTSADASAADLFL